MTKTPRHKLVARADRYWSNPAVRLACTNYKRRKAGLPEYTSVDQISAQSAVAARIARDDAGRFQSVQ